MLVVECGVVICNQSLLWEAPTIFQQLYEVAHFLEYRYLRREVDVEDVAAGVVRRVLRPLWTPSM